MIPVLRAFQAAHGISDVTVVADAGMISRANQHAIEQAGMSFILGREDPRGPARDRRLAPRAPRHRVPDGHLFTQPWPASDSDGRRDQVIYYQYRHDRGRRTLKGIDEQVAKAEKAVAGKVPVKRNRFIRLHGATRVRQPRARSQGASAGRDQGLRHQPDGPDPGVRHRRLPPAVRDRTVLPDVQTRPAIPADVPPQTRVHRGPPVRRVRRPRRQQAHRGHHRRVDPQVRQDHPPPTAKSSSKPATSTSPPPTPDPTTSTTPSARSAPRPALCTNLAQLRSARPVQRRHRAEFGTEADRLLAPLAVEDVLHGAKAVG